MWVGIRGQMEESLVPRANLTLKTISAGPLAGIARSQQLVNSLRLLRGFWHSLGIVRHFRPNVVFLTGGYVNLPVATAAWLWRIPNVIYLPDVEPGSTIKQLAGMATKIACTSPKSAEFLPAKKLVVTGYPVRAELRGALQQDTPATARQKFGLDPQRKTLFVFGGSRGAQSINQALIAILPQLLDNLQVIHIAGTQTWPEVEAFYHTLSPLQQARYRPFPYLHEEMGAAFRSADLIIARAGASMLGESPAFGLPSILIPYPHAWRYQKVNADYLVERGAGVRLDDEQMAQQLLPTIQALINDETRLNAMKAEAEACDLPLAARHIAQLLQEVASQP